MEQKIKDFKNKKAVAIKYNPMDPAPKVIATGKGYFAQTLIDKASAHKIPTYKDDALVNELFKLNLGDNIPEDLYRAVAQVLVFVTNLDKEVGRSKYAKQ